MPAASVSSASTLPRPFPPLLPDTAPLADPTPASPATAARTAPLPCGTLLHTHTTPGPSLHTAFPVQETKTPLHVPLPPPLGKPAAPLAPLALLARPPASHLLPLADAGIQSAPSPAYRPHPPASLPRSSLNVPLDSPPPPPTPWASSPTSSKAATFANSHSALAPGLPLTPHARSFRRSRTNLPPLVVALPPTSTPEISCSRKMDCSQNRSWGSAPHNAGSAPTACVAAAAPS